MTKTKAMVTLYERETGWKHEGREYWVDYNFRASGVPNNIRVFKDEAQEKELAEEVGGKVYEMEKWTSIAEK